DATLSTGGSVNLLTNYNVKGQTFAQAKSSSWVSDAADAVDSLTGGNPAYHFNGTGRSTVSGSIDVDGAIHTGIYRNISVKFTYDPNSTSTNPVIVSDNPNVTFTDTVAVESSGIVDTFLSIQGELNSYLHLKASGQDNDTIENQINFDQSEINSLEQS